jgi:hypothetical protein
MKQHSLLITLQEFVLALPSRGPRAPSYRHDSWDDVFLCQQEHLNSKMYPETSVEWGSSHTTVALLPGRWHNHLKDPAKEERKRSLQRTWSCSGPESQTGVWKGHYDAVHCFSSAATGFRCSGSWIAGLLIDGGCSYNCRCVSKSWGSGTGVAIH